MENLVSIQITAQCSVCGQEVKLSTLGGLLIAQPCEFCLSQENYVGSVNVLAYMKKEAEKRKIDQELFTF